MIDTNLLFESFIPTYKYNTYMYIRILFSMCALLYIQHMDVKYTCIRYINIDLKEKTQHDLYKMYA